MGNRRHRIVINSSFQYQYALLAVATSVLLVNLFVIVNALLPGSEGFLLSTQHILLIAGLEIILIGGVWWGSLAASHKIAGPVYVIVQQMEKLAEGDLTARVRLRKKDMFRLEAVVINQCIEELQEHLLEVKTIAQKLKTNMTVRSDGKAPEVKNLATENFSVEHMDANDALIAELNQKLSVFTFQ